MKLPPTFFCSFFQLFLYFKQYLWWITPPFCPTFYSFSVYRRSSTQCGLSTWASFDQLSHSPLPKFSRVRKKLLGLLLLRYDWTPTSRRLFESKVLLARTGNFLGYQKSYVNNSRLKNLYTKFCFAVTVPSPWRYPKLQYD